MILGLLGMAVANAAVTLGALSITRRVSSGRLSVDAVMFFLCRYILIAAAILATGVARCLTPLALTILGVLGLAVWILKGEHRRLPKFPKLDLGWPLWIAIVIIGARLLWQVWLFAPYSVDPLSYHLPKVAHWIQQGALFPYPGADVRETFPAGFELLETWWAAFLHHDVLIEMAGVEFLALGAVATSALARYIGLTVRASVFTAVLFAVTPAIALQATACMNDGAVASAVLATLALTVSRCPLLIVFASVAVGLGIKPTYGAVLPAVVLLVWLDRRTPFLLLPARRWALTFAVIAVAVGSFWYLANTARFGNPLYPVGSLQTVDKASGIQPSSLFDRLNELAGTAILDDRDHFTVQFILVAGWGSVMFGCGGIALVAMARANAPLRKLAAVFGMALLAALLIAPPGSFFLRFILFFPALGALAVCALAERLPKLAPMAWVAAVFAFASSLKPGDLSGEELRQLADQAWRERVRDDRFSVVPGDAAVVCLYGTHDDSNGESYLAYGPGFTRKVSYLSFKRSKMDLLTALRSREAWLFSQARHGDGQMRVWIYEIWRENALLTRRSNNLYQIEWR